MRFKYFLRGIAALGYTGIYGHLFMTVEEAFGLTLLSISFLSILLFFYILVYLSKFYQYNIQLGPIAEIWERKCHFAQIVLCIFGILLTIFDFCIHKEKPTAIDITYLIFQGPLIVFPEFFISIISKWFDNK